MTTLPTYALRTICFNPSRQARCVLVALAVAGASAQAAVTIYTTQASFLAAVSAPGVDTFTGFSNSSSTASPITRSAGAYGYTASVPGSFFGAGTTADPWFSTNTSTDTITFDTFKGGVQAFGGNFFGSDSGGAFAAGSVTLSVSDASGTVSQTITSATTSSFLGFVSDGLLTSATLVAVQPGGGVFLWPTADNLTLATAVPEPAVGSLILVMVGGVARRR